MISKPKFAFYLSDLRHFDYYNNVFVELAERSIGFCLVINNTLHSIDPKYTEDYSVRMRSAAERSGYTWYTLTDVIQRNDRFAFSVSTYTFRYKLRAKSLSVIEKLFSKAMVLATKVVPGGAESSPVRRIRNKLDAINQTKLEHPEQIIGEKQIFFPKGMDLNTEKYPDPQLLELVDHFLCHGFVDKELIDKKTTKPASIIGYPRYDNFWGLHDTDLEDIKTEFVIGPDRKVITWIPTYGPAKGDVDHNIHVWLPYIQALTKDFDVIVRPHPKRINRESEGLINELRAAGLKIDLNIDRDMSKLYKLSDYVLCDSGGVVFSAVYTLSNILILHESLPDFSGYPTPYLVYNVKSQLPSVVLTELEKGEVDLSELMKTEAFWNKHQLAISEVRKAYFGDSKHSFGSKTVVDILLKLGNGLT
jgi:hypothetical protein